MEDAAAASLYCRQRRSEGYAQAQRMLVFAVVESPVRIARCCFDFEGRKLEAVVVHVASRDWTQQNAVVASVVAGVVSLSSTAFQKLDFVMVLEDDVDVDENW